MVFNGPVLLRLEDFSATATVKALGMTHLDLAYASGLSPSISARSSAGRRRRLKHVCGPSLRPGRVEPSRRVQYALDELTDDLRDWDPEDSALALALIRQVVDHRIPK